ncbi:MAG: stage II sporulation protein R [Clostridia bacterium]|nr:stage II sporulation protein R [Clostridia bacterium]
MKKFISLAVITVIAALLLLNFSMDVNSSLSQGIVRLHVIANSDSDGDQLIKLKVRDAILKQANAEFTKKSEVATQLDSYKQIAESVIRECGCDYAVDVQYGNFKFPTKHYDNISLPAGNYDAVRVIIGDGKGQNWWCVLFPPLCFVDGTTDDSDAAKKMRSMLSNSEYDIITAKSKDGSVPVNIKFKIVEVYGKLSGRDKVYAKAEGKSF